jgi:hypothetical protein
MLRMKHILTLLLYAAYEMWLTGRTTRLPPQERVGDAWRALVGSMV